MSYEAALPTTNVRGRQKKLTPERIQQIKDFVQSGVSSEAIAAAIGVTVGTLKVSCSRLGISLRRPRVKLLAADRTTERPRTTGSATATFTITMQYNGKAHDTALPLTPEMISQLALEASARDQRIGELAKDILQAVTEKGLFDQVLEG
jgi:hypothetical protein